MPGDFRANYLGKVGLRGAADSRKVLDEQILSEAAVDRSKLCQFAANFDIPNTQRVTVWKLLMDILPLRSSSLKFVNDQRVAQYDLLIRALHTMRKRCSSISIQSQDLLKMWLLEQNDLSFDDDTQITRTQYCHFLDIASGFLAISPTFIYPKWMFDDDKFDAEKQKFADAYWLSKMVESAMIGRERENERFFEEMAIETRTELRDRDASLEQNFCDTNFWSSIHLSSWYRSAMTTVLIPDILQLVLDKVLAGFLQPMVYFVVELLISSKTGLLEILQDCHSQNMNSTVIAFLRNPDELSTDLQIAIFHRAIDRWSRDGGFMRPRSASSAKDIK